MLQMINLSPRLRKVIKWVGYPLFAIFAFLMCLYITFPYGRVKSLIEDHISASGTMRASIDECGLSPMLGLSLSGVKLTIYPKPEPRGFGAPKAAKPKKPKRPTIVRIAQLSVNTGLFALLTKRVDIDFHIEGLGGEIDGTYQAARKVGWALKLRAKDLNLRRLPQASAALGLPVFGRVSGTIDLTVPRGRLGQATGKIKLECERCAIGDGKAKLKLKGNPMLAMGITFPKLRLGRLAIEASVDKGRVTFDNVSSRSPDGEIKLEGGMTLRKPMAYATMNAYLQFKLSPALIRRDAKFQLLTSSFTSGKRSDGFYGLLLRGTMRNMRPRPSRYGISGRGGGRAGGRRGRFGRGRYGGTRGGYGRSGRSRFGR